jgi:hypothetical protein
MAPTPPDRAPLIDTAKTKSRPGGRAASLHHLWGKGGFVGP